MALENCIISVWDVFFTHYPETFVLDTAFEENKLLSNHNDLNRIVENIQLCDSDW